MTLTNPWLNRMILREAEGGGSPPPAAPPPAPPATPGSMFKPEAPAAGETPPPPEPGAPPPAAWEGPDWVAEKYRGAENPVEAQAQAYSEAMKKLGTKTEDLRGEIEADLRETMLAEVKDAFDKERGAPETPDLYAYPDTFEAPSESIDGAFRAWAKKHSLNQEAFGEAVELFGSTLPNPEKEREALGNNADTRIATMNAWGSKNIPAELHGAAMETMRTAAGFELMEYFMNVGRDAGYSPGAGTPPPPLTRDSIRAQQADPKYWDERVRDPAYVKMVQSNWAKFAAQEDARNGKR